MSDRNPGNKLPGYSRMSLPGQKLTDRNPGNIPAGTKTDERQSMAKKKLVKDDEKAFEKHFCHQLEVKGKYRLYKDSELSINKDLCLYFSDLEEFLQATQQEKLLTLKDQLGPDWKTRFAERFKQELKNHRLFQILKSGIAIHDIHLDLLCFQPSRASNKEQQALFEKNRFTAVRQYHFGESTQRESFDIALLANGFVIVTIELKNQGTSGDYTDAIKQYLSRNLSLPIFQQPFLHIVCDNDTVKMAAAFSKPPSKKDFRDFNKNLINIPADKREYPVHYLYHDILLPEQLMNYIETYLYPGKNNSWIFPRYHQQRATRAVVDDIKAHASKHKELNLRYLIQHSTGSGKSNTIVWMVQNLRNAYIGDDKIFDSIVVLTDRVNLDDQISKDFQSAILTQGVADYAENAGDLKKALQENKKVIVSTIHKFSYLKDLSDQTGKRICILIDEAHRSQEGKLHDGVTGTFTSDEQGIEPTPEDRQEGLIDKIERKPFPNMAFIALTATPSEKTLEHFGKKCRGKWEAHDVYSMDQAIAEGYIMDVAKHIYSYETLYELNKEVDSEKEYLPMQVRKALRRKAYQDTEIIKEKCGLMLQIFEKESAHKIKGRAKAMIVSSSRLAAVKYRLILDEEIKNRGLKHKSLVAFSGKIDFEEKSYTEDGMNKANNPKNLKTEDVFGQDDDIRFLIVANKFQTGFSEPLLHSMFVDKPLRDRNAVQTLSRLNRIHRDKKDTLVVDFTGSYEHIMKAYKKYQKNVITHKSSDPKSLFELKDALLKFAVFTESDVEEVATLGRLRESRNMPAIAGLLFRVKENFQKNLDREKRDEFRTLMSRYIGIFNYIQALYNIPHRILWDIQTFLIYLKNKLTNSDYNTLMKEIEDVRVVSYSIPELGKTEIAEDDGDDTDAENENSSVTTVRQTKTVKEVIKEINLKFKSLVTEDGIEIIGEFLESVTHDENLKTIIRNNRDNHPDLVYEHIIREKLIGRLENLVIEKSPELYETITGENIMPFINRSAYNLLTETALAA